MGECDSSISIQRRESCVIVFARMHQKLVALWSIEDVIVMAKEGDVCVDCRPLLKDGT